MAIPTVVQVTTSNEAANVSAHTVSLPGSLVTGNLLEVEFTCDANRVVTFPAGWSKSSDFSGNGVTLTLGWREIDGTEGATISVSTNGPERSTHITREISGQADIGANPPQIANASGNDINPNPPSLDAGTSDDYLWIAAGGAGIGSVNRFDTSPTNYLPSTPDRVQSGTVTGSSASGSATRALAAQIEDPGTFALLGAAPWQALTVAILGDSGGGPITVNLPEVDIDIEPQALTPSAITLPVVSIDIDPGTNLGSVNQIPAVAIDVTTQEFLPREVDRIDLPVVSIDIAPRTLSTPFSTQIFSSYDAVGQREDLAPGKGPHDNRQKKKKKERGDQQHGRGHEKPK